MNLNNRDQQTIWHPFTQHQVSDLPIAIKKGQGAYLIDENNQYYLDLVSSWWVNLHGHSHPEIAKAIYEQALTLEHVIFSGFTHEPAIELAENILQLLPTSFSKVFYSDNGSTAVEVALKMSYQYWRNVGEPQRKRFMAFKNSYHGDTFGAMSVGKQNGFYTHFEDLLFPVEMFDYPETWHEDESISSKENIILEKMHDYLKQFGRETAAFILEPLVQGAAGMKMCGPEFLRRLEQLLRQYQVLIIYDEVMTGFGRTGELFACIKAHTTPDIICLSKGLTGGFLPLAMTVCSEDIYQAFLGDHFSKALAHGHSFTANPLGCAAALASYKILMRPETMSQIKMIETNHHELMTQLNGISMIEKIRYCGTILAFDLKTQEGYGSRLSLELRNIFLQKGLLIRPLGNVIYLLPPYCITDDELKKSYEIIMTELQGELHELEH